MDYIVIGIIFVVAVTYLAWKFSGILKGKKDLGCSGCEKSCEQSCSKPEEAKGKDPE